MNNHAKDRENQKTPKKGGHFTLRKRKYMADGKRNSHHSPTPTPEEKKKRSIAKGK